MRGRGIAVGVLLLSCAGGDGGGANGTGSTGATGTAADNATSVTADGGSEAGPTTGATAADTSTSTGTTTAAASDSGDATTAGPPVEPGPIVVYVADGGSSVQLWTVDDEAANVTMQASYDTGQGSAQLALHPDGLHLYATAVSGPMGNRVISYAIDPTDGTLSQLGVTPLPFGPVYISIDPGGGYALSCSFDAAQLGVWPLGDDFVVDPTAVQVTGTPAEPHSIVPHPSLSVVFVPHRTPDLVEVYDFDAGSGALTLSATDNAPAGAGARHLAIHPNGVDAYLSDEFASAVTHFTIDPTTGEVTTIASHSTLPADFMGANTCADVHVTPDGGAVYVSNRGHDSLAMFSVADDGTLSDLGQIATEATPREFDVDPTGRFVFSLGQTSGNMATYTIADTGELAAGTVVNIGPQPLWAIAVELPAP